MAETRQLKCLTLPLGEMSVIVPSSAVAEVITLEEVTSAGKAPDWFVGVTRWRGVDVPLIAFDRLCGARREAPPAAGRFVVLYGLRESPRFYGLRIESLPRTETVDETSLGPTDDDDGPAAEKFVQMRARMEAGECAIPDFDALESAIAAHTPRSP